MARSNYKEISIENRERLIVVETKLDDLKEDIQETKDDVHCLDKKVSEKFSGVFEKLEGLSTNSAAQRGKASVWNWLTAAGIAALGGALATRVIGLW